MDKLGESGVWLTGVASGKITDFAGETDAADAPGLGGDERQPDHDPILIPV
ncbi:hypothetical protein [Streptomyces avermitilis]|uniref:hypothetical protein n=1 Tax=Streptomyces avermitilis TaxID=33903 RepID=UPI003673A3F1